MHAVPVALPQCNLTLDVCKTCQFVWFDAGEFNMLPAVPPPPPRLEDEMPQAAREKMAELMAEEIGERGREQAFEEEGPDEWWKQVFAALGLPVEMDHPIQQEPWLNTVLAAAILMASLFGFFNPHGDAVKALGLISAHPGRWFGLTWITSFFLHANLWHLAVNLYFLLVFGDSVEEFLGGRRYLFLIFSAALAGEALHFALGSRPDLPLVGASGGISGIIVFYAMQFPNARLGMLFRLGGYYFRWFTLPASLALVFWLLLMMASALLQFRGTTHISALAHLGGAMAGFFFWLSYRRTAPVRETVESGRSGTGSNGGEA
jgi:membrane associated rhomboid family serine protease/Zn-finger nucleic acid-binding protein